VAFLKNSCCSYPRFRQLHNYSTLVWEWVYRWDNIHRNQNSKPRAELHCHKHCHFDAHAETSLKHSYEAPRHHPNTIDLNIFLACEKSGPASVFKYPGNKISKDCPSTVCKSDLENF